jgi:thiol-disulfide isomerase/thioredoxin
MGAAMRRIMFLLTVLASFSFAAKPSEKLPLPKELQSELPWFAMIAKDDYATYNGVINRDNLKEFAKQKNSKKIIFSFFATWCVPCHEGLKLMSEKAGELEKSGTLVVLVNVGEDDFGKVEEWIKKYTKKEWLLGFDKFGNLPKNFGLSKQGVDISFPRTLLTDANLKPLMLIGQEGDDFPQILWE